MAKFINKKEQVYDIRLTSYGRYLMSTGKFKPAYYAFYDDNVLYDSNYAGFPEQQNHTEKRIKEETQYLESLVLFEDVEDYAGESEAVDYESDISMTPTQRRPRKDVFRFTEPIGDAYLDGETQSAPAWKVVTLNGLISSSSYEDVVNDAKIPQINIDLNYKKVVLNSRVTIEDVDPSSVFDIINSTNDFVDDNVIKLRKDDALIYAEEVNTEILNENFDIEVFEIEEYPATPGTATIRLSDSVPANDDSITLSDSDGGTTTVFTFKTSPPADRTEVQIGADIKTTMENFAAAIEGITPPMDLTVSLDWDDSSTALTLTTNLHGRAANTKITYDVDGGAVTNPRWAGTSHFFEGGTDKKQKLHKKFFQKEEPQVKDGFMRSAQPIRNIVQNYTTASVEYYFDVMTDFEIPQNQACKAAEIYNKSSYYIDLDFDCDALKDDTIFYDIYGRATEPEICQS